MEEVGEQSVLYMILVNGVHAVKHKFWQELAVVMRTNVTINDFSAFLNEEM